LEGKKTALRKMVPEDGKTRVTTSVHGSFAACRLSKYAQKQRILRRVNGRIPSQPTGGRPVRCAATTVYSDPPACRASHLPAAFCGAERVLLFHGHCFWSL